MIPPIIKHKLAGLRLRERLLDLAWGIARLLAFVVVFLLIACLIDWLVDREIDTPLWLRRSLSIGQIVAAAIALFWFILWPLTKKLTDSALALRVEDKNPRLTHRLISAVELNRPSADIQGMSPQLIAVVTEEAVAETRNLDFVKVADSRRFKRGALVVIAVLVAAVAPFLLWPESAPALLARQFGEDIDIPRYVAIEPDTTPVWPSGEKVVLRFKVKGQFLDDWDGAAVVTPKDRPAERFPLFLTSSWKPGDEEAIITAEVPPAALDFTFSGWFGDGRTKKSGAVRYVQRPVVTEIAAFAVLPEFCGLDSAGNRYELLQTRGDILGIAGSLAKVTIKTQKPIKKGIIEILGPEKTDAKLAADEVPPEIVKRRIALEKFADDQWQGKFEIKSEETGYRILVADEFDFANVPPPRRTVRLVPEDPPQVALLKEQFPPTLREFLSSDADDFVVDGLPLPQNGSIPIAYTASGTYGLGQARLLYRILKKVESGNDDPGDQKWITLPLQEVAGNERSGPFDPRLGAFENSSPKDQIFFHAIPNGTPLPRTLGGGRFDFKTTGIPDGQGGLLTLKVGDQIEYCVEILADKTGNLDRPSARSDTRVKTVVSFGDLERWLTDNLQEAQRIRQLDVKQRGLFQDQ
jgi:hypothetical protein